MQRLPPLLTMSWSERKAWVHFGMYRFGMFGALHFLDDPAWLALAFC